MRGSARRRPVVAKTTINQTAGTLGAVRNLPIAERISWLIVAATTLILPLLVSLTGQDAFRLPKLLLLQASGVVLAAVAVCSTIIGVPFARDQRWSRPLLIVIGAVLLWSTVTTLVSTNHILSIFSFLTVATATMLFVATYSAAQNRSIAVLYIALVPALINAVIAIAQRTAIWNPFTTEATTDRLRTIALLGNPNDVGMFLVAPTLAATALGVTSKKHRLIGMIIAAILTFGLLASETLGAIAALSAGLFVLLLAMRPRAAIIAAVATLLVATAIVRLSPKRWSMTNSKLTAAAHGDVDILVSGRIPAFRAAWRMFRQYPILGIGPGCFAFHYFDEKIALNMTGHAVRRFYRDPNFGEVHNEHLQILAEGGLPAYAIFIGGLAVLARISFRNVGEADGTRAAFAQRLALPLGVGIFVLALSSFPLRLAAPTENGLFICAVTLAWSQHAAD